MNTIAYFEIQADEPEQLIEFYGAVFGWKFEKDSVMSVPYWRISGAGPFGGLLKRPAPIPNSAGTNAFTCSVQVEQYDEMAKLILEHGGQIALEKFAVPGKCWQGYFVDPQGNVFGIFQVDAQAR